MALDVYSPPIDPYHVMLFYDRDKTEWYEDLYFEFLEGKSWEIWSEDIYVGPQGVAALVQLMEDKQSWFRMGDKSVPHVSLAVDSKHQAKDLGPMIRVASQATDWKHTHIPEVSFSPSTNMYRISTTQRDEEVLEHRPIRRTHGRELTDHPEAVKGLDALPHALWSQGPTNVGLTTCSPVTFKLKMEVPIWCPQYRHRPEAEEGIVETIEGLLNVGVLEPSTSRWNTPILPVEKHSMGKYRMAHDLRAINDILKM